MNSLDLILCIPLLWGGYRGFKKGFIIEIFSLGAFFLASGAGIHLVDDLLPYFKQWITIHSKYLPLLLFVLIFIITTITTICLGHLIKYLVDLTVLGSFDIFIGCVIGIAKWSILMSLIFWGMGYFQIKIPDIYTSDSFLFPIIKPIAPTLIDFIYPPGLSLYEQLQKMKNNVEN